ncbi:hypothetical protein C723_1097 [Christiangramia flava JLT2011]|nr:hypothetical protein C723_1097 [Christiangramia flava JLT2011]
MDSPEQFSISFGNFPQKLHGSPDLFNIGFWLAQVPANCPSFFPHILIAMPAKASANNTILINNNFIRLKSMQK